MDIDNFEDGSSIQWFSRESLLYRAGAYAVQVVYDLYDVGAFKTGRKIVCSSIGQWEDRPDGTPVEIDPEIKKAIIDKAVRYFEKRNIEVELDND